MAIKITKKKNNQTLCVIGNTDCTLFYTHTHTHTHAHTQNLKEMQPLLGMAALKCNSSYLGGE
jgi:hypothetical protein